LPRRPARPHHDVVVGTDKPAAASIPILSR
jgi:hypothetical protein